MVVDTGAGPNLISTEALPNGWRNYVFDGPSLNIRASNNKAIDTRESVRLFVKLGGYVASSMFVVSDNLPVPVILGTTFTEKRVKSIECLDQEVIIRNLDVLPIRQEVENINAVTAAPSILP